MHRFQFLAVVLLAAFFAGLAYGHNSKSAKDCSKPEGAGSIVVKVVDGKVQTVQPATYTGCAPLP